MHEQLIEYLNSNKSSSMPMWLKRTRPDLLDWINQETKKYTTKNTMEKVYIVLNGEPPKCSDNNYRIFNTFELGYRVGCRLSHTCADVINNRIENQKKVLMEKYGVDNPSKIPAAKEKTKQTNIKKYGYEHHSQNPEVNKKTVLARKSRSYQDKQKEQSKRKQTSIDRYGVEHHMMLLSQQEKVQETNIQRFGVAFPLQNSESVERMKEKVALLDRTQINNKIKCTLYNNHGVTAASRIPLDKKTLEILDNEETFKAYVLGKERKQVLDELGIADYTLYLYTKKYQATDLFIRPLVSQFELEVAEFLDSLGVKYIQNTRTIIAPRELDFYLPDHNIAVECSGVYWHSEISAGRSKSYHYSKYIGCKQKGVQLITLYDDEWKTNRRFSEQAIIRALKIVIKEENKLDVIADKQNIRINAGDSYIDAVCTNDVLRICKYSAKSDLELTAMINYLIKDTHCNIIEVISNNRYCSGKWLKDLGFFPTKEKVICEYTDYHKRSEILFDGAKDKIWDCGQITWTKQL